MKAFIRLKKRKKSSLGLQNCECSWVCVAQYNRYHCPKRSGSTSYWCATVPIPEAEKLLLINGFFSSSSIQCLLIYHKIFRCEAPSETNTCCLPATFSGNRVVGSISYPWRATGVVTRGEIVSVYVCGLRLPEQAPQTRQPGYDEKLKNTYLRFIFSWLNLISSGSGWTQEIIAYEGEIANFCFLYLHREHPKCFLNCDH